MNITLKIKDKFDGNTCNRNKRSIKLKFIHFPSIIIFNWCTYLFDTHNIGIVKQYYSIKYSIYTFLIDFEYFRTSSSLIIVIKYLTYFLTHVFTRNIMQILTNSDELYWMIYNVCMVSQLTCVHAMVRRC
jgi:hypothetical protein